jgi:Cyclin D1 binding domain
MSKPPPRLAGDWIGRYPGHFEEVIRITQSGNGVQAVKVTGDENVPAGEITWIADLATGIGHGQIAEKEFRGARFVPGRLVVHSSDRIEFIWEKLGSVEYRRDD